MALALVSLKDHVKILCDYSPERARYTNDGCQSIENYKKIGTALKGRNLLMSSFTHEEK